MPWTKGFICGKCIIGYNYGIDDGAESKLGTHKELIVLNILKYKYWLNSLVMCHVTILIKIVNYWPIGGRFQRKKSSNYIFLIHILYS